MLNIEKDYSLSSSNDRYFREIVTRNTIYRDNFKLLLTSAYNNDKKYKYHSKEAVTLTVT